MTNLKNMSPKILVIGDLMIDQYLWGSCERVSPEAPVQIIDIHRESNQLGGSGNLANNLKKLGANIDLISVIGDCSTSIELLQLLSAIKVETKYLFTQKNRKSSKKTRIIASQQQVVRYDRESSDNISASSQNKIIKVFKKIVQDYDAVLLSDYGKGVLTSSLTKSLINIANEFDKKVLVDPKGKDFRKYKGAYLLTPNKKEASEATNIEIKDDSSLTKAIVKLKSLCKLKVSIITLSENGVAIYDNELRVHPTATKEVFDVTGAGDTVIASLGFGLACGLEIDKAVQFSNLAAGVVVGKIGSATASLNEIIEYESSLNRSSSDKHIKSLDEIINLTKEIRSKKKKIVFTNGCFDLIHAGHISYLEKSKNFGDILIVGLNSDSSVQSIKGSNRPINAQNDRASILAALEVVDFVVIFDEDNPYELIKAIQPDVLVKGADYKGKEVVGQDLVDTLKLVEFVDGKSSTNTIKKIKNYT